jgi:hypothetical protein
MQAELAPEKLIAIRTLMERPALYRRALASVMGLVGATGLAAGALGAAQDLETSRLFAAYWTAVALLCLAEAFLLLRRQAVKEREPFWTPPTLWVARAVSPAFFTGLMVGIVFFVKNTPRWDLLMMLIFVWMALYGLALHAAGFFMPLEFRLFGWGYILAGLAGVGCWMATPVPNANVPGFPWGSSNFVMGVLFGGGHLACGLFLHFTEKREPAV